MKRLAAAAGTALLVLAALAFSGNQPAAPPAAAPVGPNAGVVVASEARNPWTSLKVAPDPNEFQFVVVSDRTGGHRARVFSKAVEQINLLRPEFVLSVGDLIEGYSEDRAKLAEQWLEFQGMVGRLKMPFFYVPGNHDLTNGTQEKLWQEKFGRRYYHFVYKDVLFLAVNSEDPPGSPAGSMSPEQLAYMKKALEENAGVRWTIVSLHKPVWSSPGTVKNGWLDFEKLLAGRNYTVFCGHIHRYQKFVRNGMNYYQFATTGGGSRLRGVRYGEFDHLVWVTMTKSGPVLANVLMDGILPEDLTIEEPDETGTLFLNRKPTHPVKGTVLFDGVPAGGATIAFHPATGPGRADAIVEADGSFVLSSYGRFDGAPVGDYTVTVVKGPGFVDEDTTPAANGLPSKYADAKSTPLRATVKEGTNDFTFELAK
jgi:hypothetical protein